MTTKHFNQRFYEASDGDGHTRQFHFMGDVEQALALTNAMEYAQSRGGYGYIVLMGRNRLNDYVGAPIWSESEIIEEV